MIHQVSTIYIMLDIHMSQGEQNPQTVRTDKMGTLATLPLNHGVDPGILMELDMTAKGHPLDKYEIGIPLDVRQISIPLMSRVQTHQLPERCIKVII